MPRNPQHQSHKLTRDYHTGTIHQNEDHTSSRLTPNVIYEISCNDCTATYKNRRTDP